MKDMLTVPAFELVPAEITDLRMCKFQKDLIKQRGYIDNKVKKGISGNQGDLTLILKGRLFPFSNSSELLFPRYLYISSETSDKKEGSTVMPSVFPL